MSQLPDWVSGAISIIGALGAIVTAIATFFLWRVTKVLANETRRMAAATDSPHIVVTLERNLWSVRHLEICIENTGNSTAYCIDVVFDPPLKNGQARNDEAYIPFQSVSVLKPGQSLRSYLSDFESLAGNSYGVCISWLGQVASEERQFNKYELRMDDHKGVSFLGESDSLVGIAKSLKELSSAAKTVSKGQKKIQVDVYTKSDRLGEREELLAMLRRSEESVESTKGSSAGMGSSGKTTE